MLGPSLVDDHDAPRTPADTTGSDSTAPPPSEVEGRWDRARTLVIDRGFTACIWLCGIALLAILARPLLFGFVPVSGDSGALFLPFRHFYADSLARGESFDWMPGLLSGYPAAGSELGPYHPARFLSYRLLRIDVAYALEIFAPSVFWLIGIQLFLQRWIGRSAAAFAALLTTFSYSLLQWQHWPHAAAILAHIPFLLWSMRWLERDRPARDRVFGAAVIALLTGSQYLLSHPQTLWFSLLTMGIYAVFLLTSRRLNGWGLAALAGAQLLAAAIGAAQTYAMYSALAASTRAADDPGLAYFGAMRPLELVSTLLPAIHWGREWTKLGTGTYLGIVPVVLCFAAVSLRGDTTRPAAMRTTISARPRSGVVWFGAALALFGFWMALGELGYLYRLQTFLPGIGKLRAPARFSTLGHLGLIVVAGCVAARLLDRVRDRTPLPWQRLYVPWIVAGVTLVLGFYAELDDPVTKLAGLQASYLTGPLIFCAATAGLTLAARGRALGLYVLLAVALFELASYNLLNPHLAKLWRDDTQRWEEWQDHWPHPPDARPGRTYAHDFFGSQLLLADIPLVNGYAGGLEVRRQLDYRKIEAVRAASAAWIFHRNFDPLPFYPGLEDRGWGWYGVPSPLARVRLVQGTRVSNTPARDLAEIDLATVALVDESVQLDPAKQAGDVRVVHDRPGRMSADVTTHGTELLVFAESFDPNWVATVDGQRGILRRVNGDFMGCVIKPGAHHVTFEYRPTQLWLAEDVSAIGAIVALFLALGAWAWGRARGLLGEQTPRMVWVSLRGLLVTSRTRVWISPGVWRRWGVELAALACLVVASAALWSLRIEGPASVEMNLLGNSDQYTYFLPLYKLTASRWAASGLPLWNPWQLAGVPLAATPQASAFYPLNLLYVVLATHDAMRVLTFIHLVLAGCFLYSLTRVLGVARIAALLGGLAYAWSSAVVGWHLWPPALGVLAWIPVPLIGIALVKRSKSQLGCFLIALGLAMQVFVGHPPLLYFGVQIAVLYAAWTVLVLWFAGDRSVALRSAAWIAGGGVLALLVSAMQWLPTIELTRLATRNPGGLTLRQIEHWGPRPLVDTMLARLKPATSASSYAGALALLLVPAAWLKRQHRSDAWFFGGLALTFFILAMGSSTPLFQLYLQVPGANLFRGPTRAVCVPALGLSVLCALGADGLERVRATFLAQGRPWARWGPLVAVGALLLGVGAVVPLWVLGAAGLAILLCVFAPARWSKYVTLALAVAMIADLAAVPPNQEQQIWRPGARGPLYKLNRDYQQLATAMGLDRVLVRFQRGHLLYTVPRAPSRHGVYNFADYEPLTWGRYANYSAYMQYGRLDRPDGRRSMYTGELDLDVPIKNERLLAAAGVHAIGHVEETQQKRPFLASEPVAGALPRAYLVHRIRAAETPETTLRAIADGSLPLREEVVLEDPPEAARSQQRGEPDPDEKVRVVHYAAEDVAIEAELKRPGALVLLDADYPGWEATVDGEPSRIFNANYLFRAVLLEPGKHEIRFTYAPASLKWGFGLALCALLAMLLIPALPYLTRLSARRTEALVAAGGAPRLGQLDVVRGLCMIGVCLIHADALRGNLLYQVVVDRAVPVLIVLFGASSELWWQRAASPRVGDATREYWKTRYLRLLPPMWIAVGLWWFVASLRGWAPPFWRWVIPHALGYVPQVATGWFVTLIVQLIVLFPLLHIAYARLGRVACTALTLAIACWSNLNSWTVVDWMRALLFDSAPVSGFFVLYYAWIFAPARLFLLVAGLQLARARLVVRPARLALALATLVLGHYVRLVWLHTSSYQNTLAALLDVPLAIVLLEVARLGCPPAVARGLSWLGRGSWGLYLGQLVVHAGLRDIWFGRFGGGDLSRWLYFAVLLLSGCLWILTESWLRNRRSARLVPTQLA
ncbi:MAG TPA: YfhO family protein [Polyangiales bacterium]|nr:YfhO family protein [Polyangiales bacterium]